MTDPRPDLTSDSKEWTRLLNMAEKVDSDLAGTLHGFRCCGLRLHHGTQGYSLRPDLDPNTSKWLTQTGYIEDRDKWLLPHQEKLIELLDRLEKEVA